MLAEALQYDGPSAIRYPKGSEGGYREGGAAPIRTLRKGNDLAIISYGTLINEALEAAERLDKAGIHAGVIKLGRIEPLDRKALHDLICDSGGILVVEECAAAGSLGEALASESGGRSFCALNLGDGIIRQGTVAQQRRIAGIDAEAIPLAALRMRNR